MTSIGQKDTKPAKTQVRAVESPQVLSLSLPHYVDHGSDSNAHGYHSLGHCLRNNIFPGAPVTWRSLSMDSYVSHPLTDWPADPHLCHSVVAMEILWSVYIQVVLFSVGAHSHRGLSCVNDYVNNVSCTWNGSLLAPGVNCSISGLTRARIFRDFKRISIEIIRTCKLELHGNSPPGCSFVFESEEFNSYKALPYIRMECDGMLVDSLTEYQPNDHIKMNPPGIPRVNSTVNVTWISWSAGSPRSRYIKDFRFQIQVKQKNKTWKEARDMFTHELQLELPSQQLKGHLQVRVRVRTTGNLLSQWSNWSPTASWVGPTDTATTSEDEWCLLDWTYLWRSMLSVGLILVIIVVIYRSCMSRRFHNKKPVPDPSKYFHSLHGGNLKKWLNPLSAPASFFTAQPCDHISPVELCEGSDVAPSTSPSSSSTTTLLQFKFSPLGSSDTSRVADNSSSSSSSCFSNMGYFLSSSSGSSAQTDPNPAYFTYHDDIHNLHNNLHLTLCPSFTNFPIYESLKKEPQSPDSGFGIGKEDEDKMVVNVKEEEVNQQTSPLVVLPLCPPPWTCPPSSPPLPPPNTPGLTQVSTDSQQVDTPINYAAWPMAGAMCRSSSMPVETCKTGYLTLKELQTTFSNKSI
ncbi:Interleukin-2 receptor subunit beta [Collichthys lucidus]|uniref:Interleukin-2 receptor subunit beta n=1 Tax=Collichthys lucidus TaxID=240159 RepID=A0A4U5VSI2_COLLU|nr:Interleukin-2 receptor subunit beta [Collichthys lucidus]